MYIIGILNIVIHIKSGFKDIIGITKLLKEVRIMKKRTIVFMLLIGILLFTSIVACRGKDVDKNNGEPTDKIEPTNEDIVENDEETIMKDFKTMVKSDNEPFTLVKFIDENIEKVKVEYATEMIKELEEVQEGYIERYTDQLFMEEHQMELLSLSEVGQTGNDETKTNIENLLFFDETKIEEIKNANLNELVKKLIQGKYRLINMEGAFYPIIDYEALKVYNDYLSEEMKEYIDIKSMDSNMPTILDAGIVISFDQLAERLVKTENYILKYPDSIKYEEILRLYGVYLKFYLEGSSNTPIYDFESKKIKDEIISSYKKVKDMDETVTSKVVSKYIDIIGENQNIIDENVLSKVTELHSEAIATIEEQK